MASSRESGVWAWATDMISALDSSKTLTLWMSMPLVQPMDQSSMEAEPLRFWLILLTTKPRTREVLAIVGARRTRRARMRKRARRTKGQRRRLGLGAGVGGADFLAGVGLLGSGWGSGDWGLVSGMVGS